MPNFGGDWLPDADNAAASADIPGPGCDEPVGPARGAILLVYEPLVKVWFAAGIWRMGGDPALERIGDAANRAIVAALGVLLGEARPLFESGGEDSGTGRGPEEDVAPRGTDMMLWCGGSTLGTITTIQDMSNRGGLSHDIVQLGRGPVRKWNSPVLFGNVCKAGVENKNNKQDTEKSGR